MVAVKSAHARTDNSMHRTLTTHATLLFTCFVPQSLEDWRIIQEATQQVTGGSSQTTRAAVSRGREDSARGGGAYIATVTRKLKRDRHRCVAHNAANDKNYTARVYCFTRARSYIHIHSPPPKTSLRKPRVSTLRILTTSTPTPPHTPKKVGMHIFPYFAPTEETKPLWRVVCSQNNRLC